MIRKFVLVLVLLCCCVSLSGCGCGCPNEARNCQPDKIVKRELRMAGPEDDEWILGLDEPVRVDKSYFR